MPTFEYRKKYRELIHRTFDLAILLKGVDGILEILGGLLLLLANPLLVNKIVSVLTQHELSKDPQDLIANYLLTFAHNFSVSAQLFGSAYLLSHGIIKIFLIISLWKRKLWAYPAAIWFFAIFGVYQIYRYFFTHSVWLIILTALDLVVIWLTWAEYKNLKQNNLERK